MLIDGVPTKSCTVLAVQADGAEIGTVEGLAGADGMSALQEGLPAGARPAVRLLHPRHADNRDRAARQQFEPQRAEIREAISGNLCRCTGYVNIVKAVEYAAAKLGEDN